MDTATGPMATIGVLHPGEMGGAVAGGCVVAGAQVVWAGEGRSAASLDRATAAGLQDVGSVVAVAAASDVVVSVCPPAAAVEVARAVAATGFAGIYVDANAVSPASSAAIHALVAAGGATFVDGGILGGPTAHRLYLSGPAAPEVAGLFGGPTTVSVLDAPAGAASALKMTYAAWTKGTAALVLAVRAAAGSLGVEDALLAEWAGGGVLARSEQAVGSARKAWRWSAEMAEIARTFDEAGLPDGFHLAAAEVFDRLAAFKDVADASPEEVLRALRRPPPS